MATPITGFPSNTAVNTGNTLAGWFGDLIEKTNNKLAPLYQPPVKTEEDLADEEYWRQYWAARDREKARREAKGAEGSKPISPSPYSNIPFGVVLDAKDALSNLFNPKPSVTQQNSNAPIAQVKDRSTGDLAPSVNRPETSFDPTRLQQGESSVNQGASVGLNLPELLQSEPYQEPAQTEQQDKGQGQILSEREQINTYISSLLGELNNQTKVDQDLEARAQAAKANAMEHDAGRIMLNLFGGRPWQSKEAYGNQAYNEAKGVSDSNQERQTRKQTSDNQQNEANLNRASGLGELINTQELYPIVKRLQEAHVASAEQVPENARITAEAMADYRAAQAEKLREDLKVSLERAGIMAENRRRAAEGRTDFIPLSGNNKAPLFDLGGAINALSGIANGGSVPQGQAPTTQDSTDDFVTE